MRKLALRAIKQLFCASGGLVSLGCALCVLWASTGLARAQDRAAQTGFTLSETSAAAWVLRFDAAISPALAQDIDAFADRFALLEQRPVLIVLLGSSGGDAYAAMQIGTRLRREGLATLRVKQDFVVEEISTETRPAEDFVLPAEPMDMQQMMRGMQP